MALDSVQILSGAMSLLVVIIAIYVGFRILAKYFEYKKREFLFVGVTSFILVEPWWPSATSFLVITITGKAISSQLYFFLGNAFIPVGLILWIAAFTDLLYKEKQKLFLAIIILFSAAFELIFFYFLFTNVEMIGELISPVETEYKYFVLGFLLAIVLIIWITGIKFARASMKTDNPELKLKGKMLIYAFTAFSVGALLDSAFPLTFITLLITRLILLSCSIGFLGGFILPNWMRKLFLREKK